MLSLHTQPLSSHVPNILRHHGTEKVDAMSHLASGLRVLKAADDPAAWKISQKMQSKIRAHSQLARNLNDTVGMLNSKIACGSGGK